MKLENTTVVIEPRTVGGCLDLAVLFYRRHVRGLLPPTLLFAAVAAGLGYTAASSSEAGLVWSVLWFFATSPLLGAIVVVGSGHAVFGSPFAPYAALRAAGLRVVGFLFHTLVERLVTALAGLPCLFLASLPVAVYFGFFTEAYLLEQNDAARSRRRLAELMQGNYVDLLARAAVLIGFAAGATATLFLLLDQALLVLFGWPLLVGRLGRRGGMDEVWGLVASDPAVVGTLAALAWLVYPLARLAWFFCYLDVRIRKEAWDLELDFRVEARRLGLLA